MQADSYYAFTNWHITELARLRFLPEEWPEDLRKMLFTLNGEEMLIISQLNQGEYDGKKAARPGKQHGKKRRRWHNARG